MRGGARGPLALSLPIATTVPPDATPGSKIHDLFASSASTAAGGSRAGSFREPEEINGKTRWQIVHIYRNTSGGESPSDDNIAIEQKVYPRGVYLPDSASLKDLRSAFINSSQLEEGETMFVFLVAKDMEETYDVDDENVFTLKDFESTMTEPHTFFITSVEADGEGGKGRGGGGKGEGRERGRGGWRGRGGEGRGEGREGEGR